MPREATPRPYRSHLRPACLPCRRRKSRCKTDSVLGQCLMCQAHGTVCVFPEESDHRAARNSAQRSSAKPQTEDYDGAYGGISANLIPRYRDSDRHMGRATADTSSVSVPSPVQQRPAHTHGSQPAVPTLLDSLAVDGEHNPHIVGPVVVNDNDMLQEYLSTRRNDGAGPSRMITMGRTFQYGAVRRPVMFSNVQKQPVGLTSNRDPAFLKTMVIEKLLEPFGHELIRVYLHKANCCLPLLDEQSLYSADKDIISPTLLASIYANALIYWRHDTHLASHRCPDVRFIWNLANEALYIELQRSPGMSTIISILLNISGRPTTAVMGNAVLIGSAIALSYSLGLNRDPGAWEISATEKNVRRQIWWAIVIFDCWSSMSYGTPPQVQRHQHDVCVPDMNDMLASDATPRGAAGAPIYIAFIGLTKILSILLDHVYRIESSGSTRNEIGPCEVSLNTNLYEWEEGLTENIRRIIIRGAHLDQPGAANFRLAYLSVKLLLHRIELGLDPQETSSDTRPSHQYAQAQRVAEEIVMLVQELGVEQLGDFWLSVSAFSLTSAMSFLVRRTLESRREYNADLNQIGAFKLAKQFIAILRSHRQQHAWDVGDLCLSQYSEVIESLEQGDLDSGPSLSNIEDFVPDVNVDQLFPSLWDMFEAEGAL
ncbi:hypothetical protein EJ05DRAFT_505128 [Pseudovirgaria hyperparasitica]|uniref:Zn(2)-C6 fungal-type domain-containing protein n=1 Tax=Pseudovirgaria hyperparasitica TaxID=470096 RepID=A0A6A6VTL8_9PEZI|nr:uncharacterized protein EJ05DRAFT_505128 [Pseudovirgaria hyperparasitica]KAF2753495.1 hypothetical protein EJ05DRAFT_505128 [Pseudovirgaria hyperparasitica]